MMVLLLLLLLIQVGESFDVAIRLASQGWLK